MIKDLKHKKCLELLHNKYIGRLAYVRGENPYVVPITYYYYDKEDNSIISYSLEGHKIDAMRKKQMVALVVDEIESITDWKSVLVQGEFEELSGIDARNLLHEFAKGVKEIINREQDKDVQFIHEFSSKLGAEDSSPIVYRIKIKKITGKWRKD